jgi:hypothetical protein
VAGYVVSAVMFCMAGLPNVSSNVLVLEVVKPWSSHLALTGFVIWAFTPILAPVFSHEETSPQGHPRPR